ncbi:MAG: 1,4-alpha-glucan branching protein GlgB [Ruminococcus sp.]|nr:1,4-alpha-glucan branching protein GlgB [Ruminococcus sp.]MCM1381731.1 1,4-alpha-glucan branching protein GlgB [Muribaculaceae bacterium]MCM1479701.1 1,4-alpha-glucan branching protein GlgB [Muribaculaceae bacterium]
MVMNDFFTGRSFDAYTYFGAHPEGSGVTFRVYAPNAAAVEVIGEWSGWNGVKMFRDNSGVYSVYCDGAKVGQMYKYRVFHRDGRTAEHSDPYGFQTELRPNCASVITDLRTFAFDDEKWLKSRDKGYNRPMNIYEVHLGSWRTRFPKPAEDLENSAENWYTYREIAQPLIEYVKERGFTHIELMPVCEHPADCSWGYQVTGFYSPTSRYGSPDDLKYMVNQFHKVGVGVICDFVPVHFAVDDYGLAEFDGTGLYEYPNDGAGRSEWGSYNFNFYRGEVCSFLQSAANYWLEEFHFDGLRMDAISNAIYWQGDAARGVNSGAVTFIRNMNSGLHHIHPTALLMAEDSTNYLKVTAPVEYEGLGFDYKWDMGFMNDTLDFFRTPPAERPKHYHKITFSMQYFYNELYLLPFSHDETVHGKAAIIQKMWGDYKVKFPQCRALYLYMFTHPGKKLNFMGNEFAQFREWDEGREQDWDILKYPNHDAFRRFFTELSRLYLGSPALYDGEYNMKNFEWLEADAMADCVYCYRRTAGENSLVVVLNLSDKPVKNYRFGIDNSCKLKEIFNSDSDIYGGSTPTAKVPPISTEDVPHKRFGHSFTVTLAPFSGKIFEVLP